MTRAVWDPNNTNVCFCGEEMADGVLVVRGAAADDERPLGVFLCLHCATHPYAVEEDFVESPALKNAACASCGGYTRRRFLYCGSAVDPATGSRIRLCQDCARDATAAAAEEIARRVRAG